MAGFVYESLYILAFGIGAAAAFAPFCGTDGPVIAGVLISVAVCMLLVSFKDLGAIARIVIAGILVTLISSLYLLSRKQEIYEILYEESGYLWFVVIGVAAFAAGELAARFMWIRIVFAVSAVAGLVLSVVYGVQTDRGVIPAAALLILLVITDLIQRNWDKSGYTDRRMHLVYVSMFIAFISILVYLSPAPERAYDWEFAKRIYRGIYEKIEELSMHFDFEGEFDPSASMIDFSDRGEISGDVKNRPREALTVSNIPTGMRYIKLSGRNFNDFDGREWTDSDESASDDALIDTVSLLASASDYTDTVMDVTRKKQITVTYRRLRTDHVFAPPKTMPSGDLSGEEGIRNLGGDMLWPGPRSYDYGYGVTFYQLNTGNPIFRDYLKNSELPSEDKYNGYMYRFAPGYEPGQAYKDLMAYRQHVYETYGTAPELSPRMRSYMDELYDGTEDIYDRLDAIEGMLRGFTYTTAPGPLPDEVMDGGSFLDYFILDKKQGYCSQFATAFVLLARAEGVPARYVQGYMVRSSLSDESVTVDSSMAHAWPEVYFDGPGWIPYEPTPLYANIAPNWKTREETASLYQDTPIYEPEYPDAEVSVDNGGEDKTDSHAAVYGRVAAISLGSGIALIILLLFMFKLIMRIRFARMDGKAQYEYLIRTDMDILDKLGVGLGDGLGGSETLSEYAERIGAEYDTRFISEYEDYLYSAHTDPVRVSDELRIAAENAMTARTELLDRLRKAHPFAWFRLIWR